MDANANKNLIPLWQMLVIQGHIRFQMLLVMLFDLYKHRIK